jgi:hypothetical protein
MDVTKTPSRRQPPNLLVQDLYDEARFAQLFDIHLRNHRNAWLITPVDPSNQFMPRDNAAPDNPESIGIVAKLMRMAGNP